MRDVKMLFSELFDMNALRRGRVKHVLLDDLKAGGWDGQLDAIVFLRADHEFPHVRGKCRLMGLEPPGADRWLLSPLSHYLGCTQDHVEQLRDMIKPYRYVGVLCFHDLIPQAHKMAGALLTDCQDQCCQAYKDRSVLLRKSPLLHEVAGVLMASTLGKHRRFIAAHIRPMPDPCLRIWAEPQEDLDPGAVGAACTNNYLLYRLVPNLQALMRRYNTSTVFVLAHPNIRHRVSRMLQAGGIRPAYIDLGALNASFAGAGGGRRKAHGLSGAAGLKPPERGSSADDDERPSPEALVVRGAGGIKSGRPKGAEAVLQELGGSARGGEEAAGPKPGLASNGPRLHTPPSVSLLAVVEEVIAAAAVAFVGSKESSMTGMIVQERLSRGMSPDDMYYFGPYADCAELPCTLASFYERKEERDAEGTPPELERHVGAKNAGAGDELEDMALAWTGKQRTTTPSARGKEVGLEDPGGVESLPPVKGLGGQGNDEDGDGDGGSQAFGKDAGGQEAEADLDAGGKQAHGRKQGKKQKRGGAAREKDREADSKDDGETGKTRE